MDDPINYILEIVKWAIIIFLVALMSDHISEKNFEQEKRLLELEGEIYKACRQGGENVR